MSGGLFHGLQLWVNLPRRDKMIAPRYQEIPSASIPVATSADGKVRVKVIAGEALGVKAAIETRTPILYQHFTLQPGATVVHPVPRDFRVFAYALSGKGFYGEDRREADAQTMVVFGDDGDTVTFAAAGRRAAEGAGRALRSVRDEHGRRDSPGRDRLPGRPHGTDHTLTLFDALHV
jgi:redox-sensitive bicupin YhaK (pirin superfamily)